MASMFGTLWPDALTLSLAHCSVLSMMASRIKSNPLMHPRLKGLKASLLFVLLLPELQLMMVAHLIYCGMALLLLSSVDFTPARRRGPGPGTSNGMHRRACAVTNFRTIGFVGAP